MSETTRLSCGCGKVHLGVRGAPIINVECCCDSCRDAGAKMATLPGSEPVVDRHGATRFVLYRKDRIDFLRGSEFLKEFRLKPGAKTRRVVATCCNAPAFLEFQGGHWLSLYGGLWQAGSLPPLDLRTMTGDLPDASVLADDVPNAKRQNFPFFVKLLGAWIAMGFRSPEIPANGEIHV